MKRAEKFTQGGFRPAFLDTATFSIHLSRFADGRPAPFHLLDGLPNDVVVARSLFGRVVVVKATLVTGFERNGFFYTISAAVRAVANGLNAAMRASNTSCRLERTCL